MKKNSSRVTIKRILPGFLGLCFIYLLLFFFARYLTTAEYFGINDCELFKGENIFRVNLKQASAALRQSNPDCKNVVLRRLLPDRIIVNFLPRRAVAAVKLSEYFFLDEQGVLFTSDRPRYDNLQLPLIIGLAEKVSQPRSGLRCNEKSLLACLDFISALSADRSLCEQVKIERINLENANDIFLFTTSGCKLNLGSYDSLNRKPAILLKLLKEIDADLSQVQYIDLRFKESVVRYR